MRSRMVRGVTLIEMLVVVTIISLFAGLVGVRYFSHVENSRRTAAKVQLQAFTAALASYQAERARFPSTEEGLQVLRPHLTNDIPLDPWSHPYQYEVTASGEPRVIAFGADGKPGGDGNNADVFSWK